MHQHGVMPRAPAGQILRTDRVGGVSLFGFVLRSIDKVVRSRVDYAIGSSGRQRSIDAGGLADFDFRMPEGHDRNVGGPSSRQSSSQLAGGADEGNSHAISPSAVTQ